MIRLSQKDAKVGLPPGTLVHTGESRTEAVTMYVMEFDNGDMREYEADSIEDCSPPLTKTATKWVHVNGVHNVDIIKKIGDYYNIHPLLLEDISSTQQRPKLEQMANGVYVVIRAFGLESEDNEITSEQVSIMFGQHFVLSFQESSEDFFGAIRGRARQRGERLRQGNADYIAYALLDLLVDKYFVVLEEIGDQIEDLEDDLVENATTNMLHRIYRTKRSLLSFRRHIWPLREVVLRLERDQTQYVRNENRVFLLDLYDHVIRATDHVETYRESITGMIDIYLSGVSNRMNEVMKVLTVVSTIFVPLTLAASIYGMNWHYMPELEFVYGYPIFLAAMFVVSLVQVAYFRRRGWM
ncbi:MAG: magnesium and cobalt transport protein CorA [Candidatus Thorarchaeota archaeon]|nr:magnesium and cobalt transport protein CorA [Candidatus Thorarchaeota archaeon]